MGTFNSPARDTSTIANAPLASAGQTFGGDPDTFGTSPGTWGNPIAAVSNPTEDISIVSNATRN